MTKDFLNYSPNSGINNGSVTLTATKNIDSERNTILSFSGSGLTKTCNVLQKSSIGIDVIDSITMRQAPSGYKMSNISDFTENIRMYNTTIHGRTPVNLVMDIKFKDNIKLSDNSINEPFISWIGDDGNLLCTGVINVADNSIVLTIEDLVIANVLYKNDLNKFLLEFVDKGTYDYLFLNFYINFKTLP